MSPCSHITPHVYHNDKVVDEHFILIYVFLSSKKIDIDYEGISIVFKINTFKFIPCIWN